MKTVLAVAALALLVACGGGGTPGARATVTVTAPAGPTGDPTEPSGQGVPAQIGDNALRLGQTRHGADVDTTIFNFEPAGHYSLDRGPDAGEKWMTVLVKTCVHKNAAVDTYTALSDSDFGFVDAAGNSYASSASQWSDIPQPHYPTDQNMRAGECVKGQVLLGLPSNVRPSLITLVSDDDHFADWRVR